jgi:hypothetical protein
MQKRFSSYAKAAQWVEEMRLGEEQHGKAIFTLSYDQLTEARSAFERLSEHNVSLAGPFWRIFPGSNSLERSFQAFINDVRFPNLFTLFLR